MRPFLAMSQRTRQFIFYVVALLLTHSLGLILLYLDVVGYRNQYLSLIIDESDLVDLMGVLPTLVVPVLFAIKIRTLREFLLYLAVLIIVAQATYVFADWIYGRFDFRPWIEDMEGQWTAEILRRCIIPIVLVSFGAMLGQLKKPPRLIARRSA